ncbi:DUF6480 family protein [Streptomyces sp. NPDC005533]|uniref:DUF6480 family protein n=1 Tax=Streptomyces sp. NPDC005533 TaxID=3364723 RepID=UPI0036923C34
MSERFPEPERQRAAGPGPEAGVAPGETPAGESSTGSGAGPYRPLTRGWGKGPLVVICLLAVVFALFFLAYAIVLNL